MNILYTIRDLHIGGTANVLLQNVSMLSKDHNIFLVYFGENSSMNKRFAEYGVYPIQIKHKGYYDVLRSALKLRKIIQKERVDVVHANLMLDKIIVPLACLGLDVKKIATLHAAVDSKMGWTKKKRLSLGFVYFLLNNYYHSIIAVSKAARISAEEVGGLKKGKAEVIYTGIKPFFQKKCLEPLFPKGSIVIGTSCRFDPVKGLIRLVRVFEKIHKNFPQTRLLLIGDGKERSKIEKEIIKLEIDEKIVMPGFTDEIDLYLNQIDFYINSSFSEALGLGTIEALSLSKPVIASNVGGLREYIKDDFNGILINFDNENSAAEEIQNFLLRNKNNYSVLSENAKVTFDENFSTEKYKKNLLNVYEK